MTGLERLLWALRTSTGDSLLDACNPCLRTLLLPTSPTAYTLSLVFLNDLIISEACFLSNPSRVSDQRSKCAKSLIAGR